MKQLLVKPQSNWKSKYVVLILLILMAFIILAGRGWRLAEIKSVQASNAIQEVNKLKELGIVEYEKPQDNEIVGEIKRVFGKHYSKAMLVLRGNGKGTCTENYHLNPKAVNTNKDGSKDYGVFQINNKWHGFLKESKNDQMLKDFRVNIAVAYRLFEDSGYKFTLWSCGKANNV